MDNSVLISRFFFNGLQQKMCLSEICFRKYSWIHYDLKGNLIVFQTFHFDSSLKVFKFQKNFWIFICWTYIILVYSQFRLEWIWKLYVLNISVPLWRSWKIDHRKTFKFHKNRFISVFIINIILIICHFELLSFIYGLSEDWRLQQNKLHQKLIVGTFETHHEKIQKDQSESPYNDLIRRLKSSSEGSFDEKIVLRWIFHNLLFWACLNIHF